VGSGKSRESTYMEAGGRPKWEAEGVRVGVTGSEWERGWGAAPEGKNVVPDPILDWLLLLLLLLWLSAFLR
jgi:hypothetical protein